METNFNNVQTHLQNAVSKLAQINEVLDSANDQQKRILLRNREQINNSIEGMQASLTVIKILLGNINGTIEDASTRN